MAYFCKMADDKRKKGFFSIMLWLCAGIIFSLSVSAMWVSGKWNPDCFWDVGQVYDCWYPEKVLGWGGTSFDGESNIRIEKEEAQKVIDIGKSDCQWRYLLVELKNIYPEEVLWNVKFFLDDQVVSEQEMQLYHGVNCFELNASGFDKIFITIESQIGSGFSISKMQLYEQAPFYNFKDFAFKTALLFAAWCCAVLLIGKCVKNLRTDWYRPIEGLQNVYRFIWQRIHPREWKIADKMRRRMRRSLFLIMILFANCADLMVGYTKAYPLTAVVTLVCLWGMALVSMNGRPQILNWRCKTVYGWFYFSVTAFISELLIPHRNGYVGVLLLAGFGFIYFVLANTVGWKEFVTDIAIVLEGTFWLSTLFCILCRPYYDKLAYLGPCTNSAVYAMYLVMIFVTLLGKLERQCIGHMKKRKKIITVAGIGVSLRLLYLTNSTASMVAVAVALLCFLYHMCVNIHWSWRKKMAGVLCGLAVMWLAGTGTTYLIANVPHLLGTRVVFKNETFVVSDRESQKNLSLQAAQQRQPVKYQIQEAWDRLDFVSSARLTFWKDYLREMNLWGHPDKPMIRNKRENPHNGVVAAGYRYGIAAVIPYCMMIIGAFGVSWNRGKRNKEKGFLLSGYMMTIMVMCMFDNVEMPLRWLLWFLLYLLIGCVFPVAQSKALAAEEQRVDN